MGRFWMQTYWPIKVLQPKIQQGFHETESGFVYTLV